MFSLKNEPQPAYVIETKSTIPGAFVEHQRALRHLLIKIDKDGNTIDKIKEFIPDWFSKAFLERPFKTCVYLKSKDKYEKSKAVLPHSK